ncbi:MAG: hypothetical protein WBC22_01335 [Sedimentisphaerales bacterium]
MIQFILVVVGLTIIICQPILLFLAAAVGLIWLLLSRPNSFSLLSWLESKLPAKDLKPDLSEDKGFTTQEEREEKIMSSIKFKEGFQDDPKWQALAKKTREHIQKAQELEEAAMRAEGQNIKNMG